MLGLRQHTCSPGMRLQDCTKAFPDDRQYTTYAEQLSNIDRFASSGQGSFIWLLDRHCMAAWASLINTAALQSLIVNDAADLDTAKSAVSTPYWQCARLCSICLHLMHDVHGARTEALMAELYDSSSAALAATGAIKTALGGVDGPRCQDRRRGRRPAAPARGAGRVERGGAGKVRRHPGRRRRHRQQPARRGGRRGGDFYQTPAAGKAQQNSSFECHRPVPFIALPLNDPGPCRGQQMRHPVHLWVHE